MNETLRVKMWGTRGSVPVSASDKAQYGGNTTCVQVMSGCLPSGMDLVIDAGSGFVPYTADLASRNAAAKMTGGQQVDEVVMLLTHYHFDHIQGLPLGGYVTYNPSILKRLYGLSELGVGPQGVLNQLFKPPFHPVDVHEINAHHVCKGMRFPSSNVLFIHPQAGVHLKSVDELYRARSSSSGQLKMADSTVRLAECLVVRMLYSEHPEKTISYRFEDGPSGGVFVFLTDNECQAGMPTNLRQHLAGTDLLIMDAQYGQALYDSGRVAGFGHATGPYCATVAGKVAAKRLGLTHHDPMSTDAAIDEIVTEAKTRANEVGYTGEIFACADYQELVVK